MMGEARNMMGEKRFELRIYGNEEEIQEIIDKQGESLFTWEDMEKKLNQLSEENEELRQQQQRLFNYFNDYLKDEMDSDNFSEMWDNVKKAVRWNNE